jgi:hypothetical protein
VSGDPRIKCACDTVGGRAIRPRLLYDKVCLSSALGESGVRLLPEGTLGRGANPFGTTFLPEAGLGRDKIASLGRRGFYFELFLSVFTICFKDVFQPCLGALGVPLITVPDTFGLGFILTLTLACSVLKVCKFQFPPIHPPLGDFQLCISITWIEKRFQTYLAWIANKVGCN